MRVRKHTGAHVFTPCSTAADDVALGCHGRRGSRGAEARCGIIIVVVIAFVAGLPLPDRALPLSLRPHDLHLGLRARQQQPRW